MDEVLFTIDMVIAILFTVCYLHQFLYIPLTWILRKKESNKKIDVKIHDFAVLISARNEAVVIKDLIDSIKNQTYPAEHVTVFVVADNCTDNTAEIARKAGAVVYERFNKTEVGKGFALNYLLHNIKEDYGDQFDAFIVFDADNILSPNYIEEMNKTFSEGHEIITSYRNSKNYGSNWISMGYALWFIRESRYLNHARHLLHVSCAIGGTGFLFSRKVMEENGGWPFHMLTEDIEFSANSISKGYKIAFCANAELFDEQPVKFSQSWRQRVRWSKGFLQVFGGYGVKLIGNAIFKRSFSSFDIAMNIMPAFILSSASLIANFVCGIIKACEGASIFTPLVSLGASIMGFTIALFVVGCITVATEWDHIHATKSKKILSLFAFPVFMLTYIPISIAAIIGRKVTWKPIEHTVTAKSLNLDSAEREPVKIPTPAPTPVRVSVMSMPHTQSVAVMHSVAKTPIRVNAMSMQPSRRMTTVQSYSSPALKMHSYR